MTATVEVQVQRDDIQHTRVVSAAAPALGDNQVRVAIEKFALTANNVTYAVAGDMVGYWNFYPAEGEWGVVPVWGIGDVVESRHPGIPVGERLYGFFPMASHATLTLGEPKPQHVTEISEHRLPLPGTYNNYRRTTEEADFLQAMEDERCLFFPLFATSYLLYDYLLDNQLFGAEQVLVGSASSKTAFGMAHLLHHDESVAADVIGITSPGNCEFVESLGIYDKVVCYGEEAEQLDANRTAAYVDMSGDAGLTRRVHELFGDNLKESCAVGATHWESFGGEPQELPGPTPEFFFAPAQIEKRDAEWGPGVVMQRASEAVAGIAADAGKQVTIERIADANAAMAAWRDMLDGKVSPDRGLMASLL
jgi:hypothetical protein